jgi:hypothetical protein
MVLATLAATYGQLGELEKAKGFLERIRGLKPEFVDDPRAAFVARRIPTELIEALMDGLRNAGLEIPPAVR